MPKKKIEHTHKYHRTQFDKSGTIIYRCARPGCPHFVYEPLIENRLSICWRCSCEFILTKKALKNKKMHCEDCTDTRRGNRKKRIIDPSLVDNLLGDFHE